MDRLKSLSAKFQSPARERCGSRFKPVASVTAIRLPRKEPGRGSNTHACRDMRLLEQLMLWVPHCDPCRRGELFACQIAAQVAGVNYDGGYADYMIASAAGLALIPEELSAVEAGPLMCAGITTFNALRHSGAKPGDLVAILGIGGLGHLAVQFAAKMGFETVAIARGADKEPLALQLGAQHYIDSQAQDASAELLKLGGAAVILATVTNGNAMSAVLGGLGINGKLMIVGAPAEPLEVPGLLLILGRRSVTGWYSGTSMDSQDTLRFSVLTGVRSMIEVFPLERVDEAYQRMMSGKARFRVVLTTGQ
jgi:D-arabinose 1-dehydrogenase-like Zn-dependent alcohol dehydrogenase